MFETRDCKFLPIFSIWKFNLIIVKLINNVDFFKVMMFFYFDVECEELWNSYVNIMWRKECESDSVKHKGACEKFKDKKARTAASSTSSAPSFFFDVTVNPYRGEESRMHVHNASRWTNRKYRCGARKWRREFAFRSHRTTENKISRQTKFPAQI